MNLALRVGAPALRGHRVPRTTPKIIETAFIAILALSAVILFGSRGAITQYQQSVDRIGHDTKPAVVTAQLLAIKLADMDAQIADSAIGDGASWSQYVADANEMSAVLTNASQNTHYSATEMAALVDLSAGLRTYYQLVGSSTVNSAEIVNSSDQLALTSTLFASRLIRNELMPRARGLTQLAATNLADAYEEYRDRSFLSLAMAVLPLLLLLAMLVAVQVLLVRRTHRLINVPLAVASAVLVAFLSWFVVTTVADRSAIIVAKEKYFDNLKAVSDAEIAAHLLKADEAMWLFEYRRIVFEQRHLRQTYARDFMKSADQLLRCGSPAAAAPATPGQKWVENTAIDAIAATLADCASFAQTAAGAPVPARYTGLLADELRRSQEVVEEQDDARTALTSFLAFLDVDQHIRMQAVAGQRPKAVQLSIGHDRSDSSSVFGTMTAALDHIIAADDTGFTQRLDAAERDITMASWGLGVVLATTILGAMIGLWPRYREYR